MSEPLPPKAGLVDADADYNVILPDKCHGTIQDSTEPPDTQAGKKMPDYPVCTDLEGMKDHRCLLYDSTIIKHDLRCRFSVNSVTRWRLPVRHPGAGLSESV